MEINCTHITINKEVNRKLGLDLLKILALFFVVTVHSFLNTGYYTTVINGTMACIIPIWCVSYLGVPVFLILSGYLNFNKVPNAKYYKRLISLFLIFIIIGIVYNLTNVFIIKKNITWLDWSFYLINFSNNYYAWYAAMFFGLFTIAPYINIGFKALNEKQKTIFVVIIASICTLTSSFYLEYIIPSWNGWGYLFPIMYYIIGLYLQHKQFNIKKYISIIVFIFSIIVFSFSMFFQSINSNFHGDYFSYSALPVITASVSLFLIFYQLESKNKFINTCCKNISSASFSIYLFSCVTDTIIYWYINKQFDIITDRMKYAPVSILLSFVLSVIFGILIFKLSKNIENIILQKTSIFSKIKGENK